MSELNQDEFAKRLTGDITGALSRGFVEPRAPKAGRTNHRLDTNTCVFFYENDFYPFSSFSAFRVRIWGQDFDTAEHAYHYAKFVTHEVRSLIKAAPSAHEAFKLAREFQSALPDDWPTRRVDVMREIIRAKHEQHEYVRQKLAASGKRELIEDSWRDSFWGWGENRDGENTLGKLWMELRAELRVSEG